MSAPGTVRFRRDGDTLDVRVEGWGTAPLCLPLRRLVERHFAEGVAGVRVGLRLCAHVDSTFVGTLLFLKRAVDRVGRGRFALVAPSEECRQVLEQMGIERAFPVTLEEEAAADWAELRIEPGDANAFRHNVVDAHRELATLDGPAGDQFREVARGMTQAMERAEGEG